MSAKAIWIVIRLGALGLSAWMVYLMFQEGKS